MGHVSFWSVIVIFIYRAKTETEPLLAAINEVGLKVNIDKTKYTYIFVSHEQYERQSYGKHSLIKHLKCDKVQMSGNYANTSN
jgi:hypothetical protein